ncbi:MAG TPA: hypothetical protein VKN18_26060 [Blastocatellia bacterium]|nr:hypothetical protein [Blastocatellia bacterium]
MNIVIRLWIVAAVLALSSNANTQSNLEELSKMRFAGRIDFECTNKTYPKERLARVVSEAMKEFDKNDAGVYGNRAVGFDLNKDGKPEYFIPLDCGVSNCMWGIFSVDPPKLLGKITAEHIYIERRTGWSAIATYVHSSAADGIISLYKYSSSSGYAKFGEDSEVNVDRKDQPASMQATRSICEKKGSSSGKRDTARSNEDD